LRADESAVSSRSRDELAAAAALYLDERTLGLGGELVDDVERTAALVCEFPSIGRSIDTVYRSIPLQRFTFNLAYRIGADEIIIVAIAHKRRRPGYWRSRT
jgi:plasmid stabilization system protein ParE